MSRNNSINSVAILSASVRAWHAALSEDKTGADVPLSLETLPIITQCRMLEQDEQILSNYAYTKKAAFASNCPHSIRSIPKPILSSLTSFPKRLRYVVGDTRSMWLLQILGDHVILELIAKQLNLAGFGYGIIHNAFSLTQG